MPIGPPRDWSVSRYAPVVAHARQGHRCVDPRPLARVPRPEGLPMVPGRPRRRFRECPRWYVGHHRTGASPRRPSVFGQLVGSVRDMPRADATPPGAARRRVRAAMHCRPRPRRGRWAAIRVDRLVPGGLVRSPRSRPWTGPRRFCRCGPGRPSGRPEQSDGFEAL